MSRKLTRLVLAATVAAGLGFLPATGAGAVEVGVDASGDRFGTGAQPYSLDIYVGDTVLWYIKDGVHTVTPKNPNWWGQGDGRAGEDLTPESAPYRATFDRTGYYYYYCEYHGSLDKGAVSGMSGVIRVTDPNATPTTTAAPTTTTTRPTTTTTRSASPPPTTTTTASTPVTTRPPAKAEPAPTPRTTSPRAKKDRSKKPEEETTTTTEAPPAPVDLPDSAIIPRLPTDATSTTRQDGVEDPGSAPEGDVVALLKSDKRGGRAKKMLIASGLGLGLLGFGTAGYKYANRSSKYFPA